MPHPAFTYVAEPGAAPVGPPGGRLSGWHIPIKDGTDVAGMPTTNGNPARAYTARETDPFVRQLLNAGAEIHAKTLTSELGATCYAERPGVPVLESPAFPGCTPGGSSTGAAVVVADGTARAAHGTDAGGSIRVPAAACNVVGLKLSSQELPAHGFLTGNVADLFTLTGWVQPIERRMRVGVLTTGVFARPEVAKRRGADVEKLAGLLGRRHEVVEISPYAESRETYAHFTTTITRSFRNIDPRDNAYIAWLVEQAKRLTPAQVAAAWTHTRALPELIARQWDVDAVLSPTIAYDPPPLGHFPSLAPEESFHAQTHWSPWCSVFNMLGTPAIALGGVHLGSLRLSGPELLALAREAEELLGR